MFVLITTFTNGDQQYFGPFQSEAQAEQHGKCIQDDTVATVTFSVKTMTAMHDVVQEVIWRPTPTIEQG